MVRKKPITYNELKVRVHNRYGTLKKDNGGKSLTGNGFQKMVRTLFYFNGVDYTRGQGQRWYRSIMLDFASRGGQKSAKVPKKKRMKKLRYKSYKQVDFNFLKDIK